MTSRYQNRRAAGRRLADRQKRYGGGGTLAGARAARPGRQIFVQADSDLLKLAVAVAGRAKGRLREARIRGRELRLDLSGAELHLLRGLVEVSRQRDGIAGLAESGKVIGRAQAAAGSVSGPLVLYK